MINTDKMVTWIKTINWNKWVLNGVLNNMKYTYKHVIKYVLTDDKYRIKYVLKQVLQL